MHHVCGYAYWGCASCLLAPRCASTIIFRAASDLHDATTGNSHSAKGMMALHIDTSKHGQLPITSERQLTRSLRHKKLSPNHAWQYASTRTRYRTMLQMSEIGTRYTGIIANASLHQKRPRAVDVTDESSNVQDTCLFPIHTIDLDISQIVHGGTLERGNTFRSFRTTRCTHRNLLTCPRTSLGLVLMSVVDGYGIKDADVDQIQKSKALFPGNKRYVRRLDMSHPFDWTIRRWSEAACSLPDSLREQEHSSVRHNAGQIHLNRCRQILITISDVEGSCAQTTIRGCAMGATGSRDANHLYQRFNFPVLPTSWSTKLIVLEKVVPVAPDRRIFEPIDSKPSPSPKLDVLEFQLLDAAESTRASVPMSDKSGEKLLTLKNVSSVRSQRIWTKRYYPLTGRTWAFTIHSLRARYRLVLAASRTISRGTSNGAASSSERSKSSDAPSRSSRTTELNAKSPAKRIPDDDGDWEDSEGGEGRRKRRRFSSTSSVEIDGKLLACPYYKYDPGRYSERNVDEKGYRGCSSCYTTTISRLKQHLYRVHRRPDHYCNLCFEIFHSEQALKEHNSQRPCCEMKEAKFQEKMTKDQESAIKRRQPGKDRSQTWYYIFRILFPDAVIPQTPYAEDLSPAAAQDFVKYFQHQAPKMLSDLVRSGYSGLISLRHEEQRILDAVLDSAVSELIHRFQSSHDQPSESSSTISLGSSYEAPMTTSDRVTPHDISRERAVPIQATQLPPEMNLNVAGSNWTHVPTHTPNHKCSDEVSLALSPGLTEILASGSLEPSNHLSLYLGHDALSTKCINQDDEIFNFPANSEGPQMYATSSEVDWDLYS